MKLETLKTIEVFPASAGVIPVCKAFRERGHGFPRIRGGDPIFLCRLSHGVAFSPHPRG